MYTLTAICSDSYTENSRSHKSSEKFWVDEGNKIWRNCYECEEEESAYYRDAGGETACLCNISVDDERKLDTNRQTYSPPAIKTVGMRDCKAN